MSSPRRFMFRPFRALQSEWPMAPFRHQWRSGWLESRRSTNGRPLSRTDDRRVVHPCVPSYHVRGRHRSSTVVGFKTADTTAETLAAKWGVGARMRAGLRASNRRARHLPMRYETGLPSSVIRFRTLHAEKPGTIHDACGLDVSVQRTRGVETAWFLHCAGLVDESAEALKCRPKL